MAHDALNHISVDDAIPASPGTSANQRHEGDFRHARHHSFMVVFLKAALPVVAFGLIAWFGIAFLLRSERIGDVVFDNTGISDGKLVMEAPRVKGFSKDNRPYDLNAVRAVQDLKKPGLITLELIDAKLPTGDGNFADLDAKGGVYNSSKEWLSLRQDIVVNRKDGTKIELETAEIDLKNGTMVSNKAVVVETPTSNITADNMEIIENGAVVVFKKRVRMTIQPADDTN